MARREKGVATTACPTCNNDLNAVQLPDGATAFSTCTTCYSAKPESEKASSRRGRETGTKVNGRKN